MPTRPQAEGRSSLRHTGCAKSTPSILMKVHHRGRDPSPAGRLSCRLGVVRRLALLCLVLGCAPEGSTGEVPADAGVLDMSVSDVGTASQAETQCGRWCRRRLQCTIEQAEAEAASRHEGEFQCRHEDGPASPSFCLAPCEEARAGRSRHRGRCVPRLPYRQSRALLYEPESLVGLRSRLFEGG